jgi:DNA-directed RNA polymerase subunit RPC12/RpoP
MAKRKPCLDCGEDEGRVIVKVEGGVVCPECWSDRFLMAQPLHLQVADRLIAGRAPLSCVGLTRDQAASWLSALPAVGTGPH